jgi:diaminohydroxyphosphoribosylaminopyrimidine deaminase / 5-amino-6-(5-phosphoribosylamino)uracil reductase
MDEKEQLLRDEKWMRRALRLAKKGKGCVSPNPLVGAVIVKDGRIIGEGWHRRCGENHAEINAMESATESIRGATFYVTLEPCSHHGRTPPCADALVAHSPARVVIGTKDPNPLVSGKGIEILRGAGIQTDVGTLEKACVEINQFFFKYIRTGLPYVTLKFAQSLDGRIATASGDSRWISSPKSLRFAHHLRAIHDAVLVGAGAVRKDNPKLTCRLVRGRDPIRIALDSRLELPIDREIFVDGKNTLVACTDEAPNEKRKELEKKGIEIIPVKKDAKGRVSPVELLRILGERNLSSVLVEGGAQVATSFLEENLVDRLLVIVAPRIIGRGINAIGDLGVKKIEDARHFSFWKITRSGDDLIADIRLSYYEGL